MKKCNTHTHKNSKEVKVKIKKKGGSERAFLRDVY